MLVDPFAHIKMQGLTQGAQFALGVPFYLLARGDAECLVHFRFFDAGFGIAGLIEILLFGAISHHSRVWCGRDCLGIRYRWELV